MATMTLYLMVLTLFGKGAGGRVSMSSVGSLLLLVRPGIMGSCRDWTSVGVCGEWFRGSVLDKR